MCKYNGGVLQNGYVSRVTSKRSGFLQENKCVSAYIPETSSKEINNVISRDVILDFNAQA